MVYSESAGLIKPHLLRKNPHQAEQQKDVTDTHNKSFLENTSQFSVRSSTKNAT